VTPDAWRQRPTPLQQFTYAVEQVAGSTPHTPFMPGVLALLTLMLRVLHIYYTRSTTHTPCNFDGSTGSGILHTICCVAPLLCIWFPHYRTHFTHAAPYGLLLLHVRSLLFPCGSGHYTGEPLPHPLRAAAPSHYLPRHLDVCAPHLPTLRAAYHYAVWARTLPTRCVPDGRVPTPPAPNPHRLTPNLLQRSLHTG